MPVTDIKKLSRRQEAAKRLHSQLERNNKTFTNKETGVIEKIALTKEDRLRIAKELEVLGDYMQGKKKVQKNRRSVIKTDGEKPKDKWFIDIHSISTSYVKRSVRKKNKGKSTKKLKRVKSVNFIRSVVARDGDITAYREGRMGISNRLHTFRMRKEVPISL